MTPAEVIDEINQYIVANNNKDITAVVLNPILVHMVQVTTAVPLTTKGDILVYGNSGLTRLAVGVDGQVLISNSLTATGLEWSTISYPVTSVFGRTGVVIAANGDYDTDEVTEATNLYFTQARARLSLSGTSNRIDYNNATGQIDIAATYVGQATITTLGTIGTGTWNATTIAINKGGTGAITALAAFDNLSPLTTKGDLLTRNNLNNIRVAVGADGQVLVADSAEAGGIKWGSFSTVLSVGVTPITGGASNNIAYHSTAGNTYAESNFFRFNPAGPRLEMLDATSTDFRVQLGGSTEGFLQLYAGAGALKAALQVISGVGEIILKDTVNVDDIFVGGAAAITGLSTMLALKNPGGTYDTKKGLKFYRGGGEVGSLAYDNLGTWGISSAFRVMGNTAGTNLSLGVEAFPDAVLVQTGTGFVGIRNTSPGAMLDVNGSGSTSGTYGFRVRNSSNANAIIVDDDTHVGFGSAPNASARVIVQESAIAIGLYVTQDFNGGDAIRILANSNGAAASGVNILANDTNYGLYSQTNDNTAVYGLATTAGNGIYGETSTTGNALRGAANIGTALLLNTPGSPTLVADLTKKFIEAYRTGDPSGNNVTGTFIDLDDGYDGITAGVSAHFLHFKKKVSAATIDAMIINRYGVVQFEEYTVANVPSASASNGGFIMVTDETGGYVPAFSDGTNWRRVTDRAIVS